jgi:hypothetical protein
VATDKPVRYFIYRVTITRPDGTSRSAVVKTTSRERDPGASIYGLHAELARLQEYGTVLTARVTIPKAVGPRQRERLERFAAVLPHLIGGAA